MSTLSPQAVRSLIFKRRSKRRDRRQQHVLEAIAKSGIPHRVANGGQAVLFRIPGLPNVDYSTRTGRWTVLVPGGERFFANGSVDDLIVGLRRMAEIVGATLP